MRPLQKVLSIRESSYLKSKEPGIAFRNRMKAPSEILKIIEKSNNKNSIKLEARRQYIVSLCAAFETFWRDFFKTTVDLYKLPIEKGSHLNKISFNFSEIKEIVGRKLTLGELITTAYVFQGTEAVNNAASEILGINAFRVFSEKQFLIKEVSRKNRSQKNRSLLEQKLTGAFALKQTSGIERAFTIRHETVHHIGTRYRPSYRDILMFDSAFFTFNSFFSLFVGGRAKELSKTHNKSLERTRKAHRSS